jgi:hypothetical protein
MRRARFEDEAVRAHVAARGGVLTVSLKLTMVG